MIYNRDGNIFLLIQNLRYIIIYKEFKNTNKVLSDAKEIG